MMATPRATPSPTPSKSMRKKPAEMPRSSTKHSDVGPSKNKDIAGGQRCVLGAIAQLRNRRENRAHPADSNPSAERGADDRGYGDKQGAGEGVFVKTLDGLYVVRDALCIGDGRLTQPCFAKAYGHPHVQERVQ